MTGDNNECDGFPAMGPTASSDRSLVLKCSDLLAGDVLLYRSRPHGFIQEKIQKKISSATNSPYTHAAIYVGVGEIAESVAWPCLIGVRKRSLEKSMKGVECIGVLRSQMGFGCERQGKLKAFIDSVLKRNRFYNLIAVRNFERDSDDYFGNQLEFIRDNYGKVTSHEKFAEQSFFCSALVVACYSVVGIIGETAQVAYPPDFFSPAGLYRDPTFGWLLGYLLPPGGSIPDSDPLLSATLWRDSQSVRWWA